jgi:hypothetical protein
MSRTIAVAAPAAAIPSARRSAVLRAGLGLAALTALAAFAPRAGAQRAPVAQPFEVRPLVGAFVPTGAQRDILKDAVLVGAQASYALNPHVALLGSFGWAPSKDQTFAEEKVDLFQYELGVEGRLPNLTAASRVVTRPYASVGVGGRTYDYRDLAGAGAETNLLGFGGVGLDVAQRNGPIGVRIEARDNVTAFKGLRGELAERKARNDLQFTAGLTFAF